MHLKPTPHQIREQVLAQIEDVIRTAQDQGQGDGVDAARRAFPGTPEDVLWQAWARVDGQRTDAWWRTVEKTIDGEIVRRALAAPHTLPAKEARS